MDGQPQPPVRIPKMQPVQSSHIAQAGHDPVAKNLVLAFHNGDVYHYAGVPDGTYVSMLAAKSVGRFFNAKIKGCYPSTKLKDHRQKQ